jgi:hypothetical protein
LQIIYYFCFKTAAETQRLTEAKTIECLEMVKKAKGKLVKRNATLALVPHLPLRTVQEIEQAVMVMEETSVMRFVSFAKLSI